MSLKLGRSNPPEWLHGNVCTNQVTARLQGEAGLSVSVPVSLLVADSRLAREVLSGHEADQEGRVIMAEVEGDTLRQYSQLLRTGTTEIKAGDRRMKEESVDKLWRLLRMLESQIVLDHEGIFGMEEDSNTVNVARNIKKPASRRSQCSQTGSRSNLSTRKSLNSDSESNNNDEEDKNQKDIANRSSQMSEIVGQENRSSSIIPPLSPAVSSSIQKCQVKPRTSGPRSKTIQSKKGSEKIRSSQTVRSHGDGRGQRLSFLTNEKIARPLSKSVIVPRSSKARSKLTASDNNLPLQCQDGMPDFHDLDPDMDMGTAESMRSESKKINDPKLAVIIEVTAKKKKADDDDDGYESLLAPAKKGKHDDDDDDDGYEYLLNFKCQHCDWGSTNPGSLGSHMVKRHPEKVEVFKCDNCQKKFIAKQTWNRHKAICGVEKTSPICKATLTRKENLMRHKQESGHGSSSISLSPSNKASKFKCKNCHQSFKSQASLSIHKNVCKGSSSSSSNLTFNNGKREDEEETAIKNQNEDDGHLASDHEDLEDTRDDHVKVVSCKDCGGSKFFSQESFVRHQKKTGHTAGETIRLPSNLSI